MKEVQDIVSSIAQGHGPRLWATEVFIDALSNAEYEEVEEVLLPFADRGIFASGYLTAALKYIKGGSNTAYEFSDLPSEDQESIIFVICAAVQVLEMRKKTQAAKLVAGRIAHLKWLSDCSVNGKTIH